MQMSGADIVLESLKKLGIDTVFGYPGGAVLYIYDALYKQDSIQHVLVRHEQAAAHKLLQHLGEQLRGQRVRLGQFTRRGGVARSGHRQVPQRQ